jgi:PhnB protein
MNRELSPVVPYLTVDDARAAIRFYTEAFAAHVERRQDTPDGSKVIHAQLAVQGGTVMLSDDFPEVKGGKKSSPRALGGSPVMIALQVADADGVFAAATRAGATVVMPLADQFWGDRFGVLEDPFGHRWSISTPKRTPTEAELLAGAKAHFGA